MSRKVCDRRGRLGRSPLDLDRCSGIKDEKPYPSVAAEGFHVILTNDARRMRRLEPYGDGLMVREFRDP
ncbi:hypothetical protein [Streptosporangium sp. NPDC006007]|uniref:hypothetical protein n=1 Tax=Streptosporangium sp. NPDC006007 TaxID=3154575 RepID=UPI0033AA1320